MGFRFPLRKLIYTLKVVVVVSIIVSVLMSFDLFGWSSKKVANGHDNELEMEIRADEAKVVPGLGEGGVPVVLTGDDLRLGQESERKYAMNVYLSDRISLNRTLKDYRHPWCDRVSYDPVLPSVSVIIVFHNEPLSALLRTVWSVLNSLERALPCYKHSRGHPGQDPNSKYIFLKEIILVDDNSTTHELKDKLSYYIRTRMPTDIVKLVRLPERRGLMWSRAEGARLSRGHVLAYLDAHCECAADWVRPLLQRLTHKHDAVLAPLIDVIRADDFGIERADMQVGGFTFAGHFTWIDVPDKEKARRGSDISPTWSPTMAGGLFAINRAYFWQLGGYDELMSGWGGENLELSFRVWQCGGTLETVPCSRVGHVFREFHPYGLPAHTDTHGINTARMAEVWMDEYKELYYMHRPDLRNNPKIGDVTHRRVLREKLHCKSFTWYLQNIYPHKYIPTNAFGYGRIRNPSSDMCLDNMQREGDSPLGIYKCHDVIQPSQYWSISHQGQLRDEERCAEEHRSSDKRHGVMMMPCKETLRVQRWRHLPSGQLQHVASSLCLSSASGNDDVALSQCQRGDSSQIWTIDYSADNNYTLNKSMPPTEQEVAFEKIRRQHRSPASASR